MEQIESTRFIEAYDFQSAFEHILSTKQAPNKGINEDDPYENCFYRVLGDICLSRAERDVGTFIRRLVNSYVSAQPQPDAADVHNQWMKEEVTLQHEGEDDYQQLPRYTSALYEYGQERGGRPQKEVKQLTFDPIEFQAILVFGKHRGSGIGRSKKIAGHLAAKDLCQQLGIHL
jgi:dsRNA-specific ribonuclease